MFASSEIRLLAMQISIFDSLSHQTVQCSTEENISHPIVFLRDPKTLVATLFFFGDQLGPRTQQSNKFGFSTLFLLRKLLFVNIFEVLLQLLAVVVEKLSLLKLYRISDHLLTQRNNKVKS